MRTAVLYLANILGSAAGSVLTGFVLMNYLGLVAIEATLVLAGIACILLLDRVRSIFHCGKSASARPWPRYSASWRRSPFRACRATCWRTCNGRGRRAPNPSREVVENRSGIITVTDHSIVFGNGMYDGRFNTDLVHDINGIVRPYALSLFHPAPRDVLMIGLATGSWAQVLANNPDVASLTIVEINPGYLTLMRTPRRSPRC